MSDMDLWIIGWAIGGAIVLVTALLLIAILLTAWGIEKHAGRALEALHRIDGNTKAIWTLGSTAKRFDAIRDYVESLENKTARMGADADERRMS